MRGEGFNTRHVWIVPSPVKLIIGDDNICPVTKLPCDDECCSPGSECNISGIGDKSVSGEPSPPAPLLNGGGGKELDWTEDFHLENGNYQNRCISCNQLFVGYKRRQTCKKCATESTIEFKAKAHCNDNKLSIKATDFFIQGAKFAEKVYDEQISSLKQQIIELVTSKSNPL